MLPKIRIITVIVSVISRIVFMLAISNCKLDTTRLSLVRQADKGDALISATHPSSPHLVLNLPRGTPI